MDRAVQEYKFWEQSHNTSKMKKKKIEELCKKHEVTKTPLRRRLGLDGTARVFKSSNTGGRETELSAAYELDVVKWLKNRKINKLSVTLPVLQKAVRLYSGNPNFKASNKWWRLFKQRHAKEDIDLEKPQMGTASRAMAKTEKAVRQHFDVVAQAVSWVCEQNGVEELLPAFVGNVDEKPISTRKQVSLPRKLIILSFLLLI